ncbi:hypothetical protein [Peribacillus acanthi]|uniref:hypothetical protein n=1 Tax=Peribacillus acanthi TaxID=2171554 RepID=UPI000D3E7532|nr:hypothetical protein [Peribacillus acanthi]
MLKELSSGIKISISRSISTAFEQYMNKIEWDEDKANIEEFANDWKEYINKNASWYDKVDDQTKANPTFHEELAVKMNETIEKILTEEPTAEQIEEIEKLAKQLKIEDPSYSCRAEARYVIDKLNSQLQEQ